MSEAQLEVTIDGERIATNDFVRRVFIGVVEGLVRPLKGVEDPKEIVIRVRTGEARGREQSRLSHGA